MSGSSGRNQQASVHNPEAQTDIESTSEWKARNRPDLKITSVAEDALVGSKQSGAGSERAESGGKKWVRLPSNPYDYERSSY
jgi:hypothetical protein